MSGKVSASVCVCMELPVIYYQQILPFIVTAKSEQPVELKY